MKTLAILLGVNILFGPMTVHYNYREVLLYKVMMHVQ